MRCHRVDALPGPEPSPRLVAAFLNRGIDVVSANKVAMAEPGPALGALAARHGASLRYSAAVGGSAPMIETVRHLAASGEITSLSAILSGTCNFVLEQCERGVSLHMAVRDAQSAGLRKPTRATIYQGAMPRERFASSRAMRLGGKSMFCRWRGLMNAGWSSNCQMAVRASNATHRDCREAALGARRRFGASRAAR